MSDILFEPAVLEVGHRVRVRRVALGMSQEVLAEQAGLHRTYIGAVERGERNVTLQTLLRLAGALKVDVAHLVEGLGCG